MVMLLASPYLRPLFFSPEVYDRLASISLPSIFTRGGAETSLSISQKYDTKFSPIYEQATITQGAHDDPYGNKAIDIAAGYGSKIYAPISGTTECFTDIADTTVLRITNEQYRVTMLHGNYSVCGGYVSQRGVVGTEASNGKRSTGAHTHIAVCEWAGSACVDVDPLELGLTGPIETRAVELSRPTIMVPPKSGYGLSISTYDPAEGGTNCDHDCTTMASGDKVADWIGGRGGVFAAACPREWGWQNGTQFVIGDTIFECRDTGGWINCYSPGDVDLAIQNAHTRGYLLSEPAIAEESYCWVDLLGDWNVPYGTKLNSWGFR